VRWSLWRRRDALVCRQAVELVTAYLDGELPPADRTRLERHLAGCPHCTAYVEQIRTTVTVLGRVQVGAISDTARADLVRLYRQWQAG
jgi:anti-sigma factor RsiW